MANITQLFCDSKPIRLLEKQRSLSEHSLITKIIKTTDTVLICKCYCNIELPYTGVTTTDNNNNNNNNNYINNNKKGLLTVYPRNNDSSTITDKE